MELEFLSLSVHGTVAKSPMVKNECFFSDDSMWCFVTDESLDWGEIANVELEKYKAYSGVDAGIFW